MGDTAEAIRHADLSRGARRADQNLDMANDVGFASKATALHPTQLT